MGHRAGKVVTWTAALLLSVTPLPADAQDAAERAFASGDFDKALKKAERRLARQHDNARAHYLAGAAGLRLLEQGSDAIDETAVRSHLEKAAELDPRMEGLNAALARFFLRGAGDPNPALYGRVADYAERELSIDPDNAEAIVMRAVALHEIGAFQRAVPALEAWIDRFPYDTKAFVLLASARSRLGQTDEAMAVLDRIPRGRSDHYMHAVLSLSVELSRQEEEPALLGLRRLEESVEEPWLRDAVNGVYWIVRGRDERAARVLLPENLEELPDGARDAVRNTLVNAFREARRSRSAEPRLRLVLRHRVQPRYPEEARVARRSGKVLLVVLIGEDGVPQVLHAQTRSPGFGFEEAATEAVSRWRYEPVMRDGMPVPYLFWVNVDFTLG